MIEEPGLDAIVIVTPEDLHYEITMAAIYTGLHVLSEKPLALRGEQAMFSIRAFNIRLIMVDGDRHAYPV